MARSNSTVFAPRWLRCACCVMGMLPCGGIVVAQVVNPNVSTALCVPLSFWLFAYSLHTLANGRAPSSVQLVTDIANGRLSTTHGEPSAAQDTARAGQRSG